MQIILASQSKARQNMLREAGVDFQVHPANIDESAVQNSGLSPQGIAKKLAAEKALAVAENHPDSLVIGADQVLECDGKMLNKAADKNEAREKLQTLRGKTHHLMSAVCVVRGKEILWQHDETAALTMLDFDDDFLQSYIEKAGETLTRSVGAYELESLGSRLFTAVDGDYFTILGMPLLPLLNYLKTQQGLKI